MKKNSFDANDANTRNLPDSFDNYLSSENRTQSTFQKIIYSKYSAVILPLVIFFMGLLAGVTIWYFQYTFIERDVQAQFQREIQRVQTTIRSRLTAYQNALKGAAGYATATEQLNAAGWSRFIGTLEIEQNLPGITSVSFVDYVLAANLDQHLQQMRAEGFSDYKVYPDIVPTPTEFFPLRYIEPYAVNKSLQGLNLGSEKTRLATVEAAIASGQPVLSSKITLVQDNTPGFIMVLPVYKNSQLAAGTTPQERRALLKGLINVPIRVNSMLSDLQDSVSPDIRFQIFDSESTLPTNLIFDSNVGQPLPAKPLFERNVPVRLAQHTWLVKISSLPKFDDSHNPWDTWPILAAGILVSFLLAGLSYWFLFTRTRQALLIRQKNAQLEQALVALRLRQHASQQISQGILAFTEQLNYAAQQQNSKTIEQLAAVTQITGSLEELNQTAIYIAQAANLTANTASEAVFLSGEIKRASDLVAATTQEGNHSVAQLVRSVEEIHHQIDLMAERFENLTRQANDVMEINRVLDDIARETHLLSLNAAIEAASTGSGGYKGTLETNSTAANGLKVMEYHAPSSYYSSQQSDRFKVIAHEVKNLSQRSRVSTEQVRTSLQRMQYALEAVAQAAEESKQNTQAALLRCDTAGMVIGKLNEVIEDTNNRSWQIIASIEEMRQRSEEIKFATTEQQVASSQILTMMKGIGETAENNLAVVSQLSATANQVNEQVLTLSNELTV